MRKTLIILRHEFGQTLKRKSFILVTLAVPLLLFLGYGIYEGVQHWYQPGEPEGEKIGYVDQAGMFDDYTSQLGITFVPYTNEDEARGALLSGEVAEFLVIHGDYLFTGRIDRYTTSSEFEVPGNTWRAMEDFLLSNLLASDVSPDVLDRVKFPIALKTVQLDESGEAAAGQDEATKIMLPIVFGMLFIFAILFSSGHLFQSVAEEKENRVIEVILSSVSSKQLLAGKVLGLGAAGLLQVAVWLVSLRVFADVASDNIPALSQLSISSSLLAWAVVYFILGYLLFAALNAGIGSLGSTAREAQGLSFLVVVPALLPLWFSAFIITNPEGIFARALTLYPPTAPVTAMMRLPTQSMPAWEIVLSLAILAGSVALTMWVAAKVFRVFLLMYGKRPAIREIVRYVREA